MSQDTSFDKLVAGIRAGDDEAAAEMVRRYESAIRRAVRYRLSDTRMNPIFDSMDICQSVLGSFFVRAAAGQYELDTPEGVTKLLIGMVKNKLAMQVRKQRAARRDNRRMAPNALDDLPLAAGGATPSQQVAARDLLGAVQTRLSDEERQIVAWRQDGLEWADIATRLNSSAEAIRKKFSRAIDRVAVQLGIDESEELEQ